MKRTRIDLSTAVTAYSLPDSVSVHGCKRIGYTSLLSLGHHTLRQVVDLARERLTKVLATGGLGYIGATRDPLDRFHVRNPHFPRFRSMQVLAFADTDDICTSESACLQELLSGRGLTNSRSSKGGEHIPLCDRLIYLYLCSTEFALERGGCNECSVWEDRVFGKPGSAHILAKSDSADAHACAPVQAEAKKPKARYVSELVANLSYNKIKDRLPGDEMSTMRFRQLMQEHLPPSTVQEIEQGVEDYANVCLTMHCVVGRGYFANRL